MKCHSEKYQKQETITRYIKSRARRGGSIGDILKLFISSKESWSTSKKPRVNALLGTAGNVAATTVDERPPNTTSCCDERNLPCSTRYYWSNVVAPCQIGKLDDTYTERFRAIWLLVWGKRVCILCSHRYTFSKRTIGLSPMGHDMICMCMKTQEDGDQESLSRGTSLL